MMTTRSWLIVLALVAVNLGVIGACVPGTNEASKETPLTGASPTALTTTASPETLPTSTPDDKATPTPRYDNGCFVPIDVVPGKTTEDEVAALWGEPDSVAYWDGDPEWVYSIPGQIYPVDVLFRGGKVDEVWFPVAYCTLGDVVATLGPPEILRVILPGGEPPIYPTQCFEYPSQGVSFRVPCDSFSGTPEYCLSFRPTDLVDLKSVFPPTTVEAFLSAYPSGKIVEWTGFDP